MSQYPDYLTVKTLEGCEVAIYSKKQREVFESNIKNSNNYLCVKIVKQFTDGDILVHKFFMHENNILGYALTIGKRGGVKTSHNFNAYKDAEGKYCLSLKL